MTMRDDTTTMDRMTRGGGDNYERMMMRGTTRPRRHLSPG